MPILDAYKSRVLFYLGHSIERDGSVLSGFQPGEYDKGIAVRLFSKPRLWGAEGALIADYASEALVIVSGQWKEDPSVSQAEEIRNMLVMNFGVSEDKVVAVSSVGNTLGNLGAIRDYMQQHGLKPEDCAVLTSHYHIPRVINDLFDMGMPLRPLCAEAVWLTCTPDVLLDSKPNEDAVKGRWRGMLSMLRIQFGQNEYTDRVIEEIVGLARKYTGLWFERPFPTNA